VADDIRNERKTDFLDNPLKLIFRCSPLPSSSLIPTKVSHATWMVRKSLLSEQAYWTLVSILSRILPQGYYTPDLLSSRADQLVLAELVAQYVPKVHTHLEDLGVDLSSITFGWFLSLFTDCLPVEVSPLLPR
jgi:hypothetical protein